MSSLLALDSIDQLNVSLLNAIINFFKKNVLLTTNFGMVVDIGNARKSTI